MKEIRYVFLVAVAAVAFLLFLAYHKKPLIDGKDINYWYNYKTKVDTVYFSITKLRVDTVYSKIIKPKIQVIYIDTSKPKVQGIWCNIDSMVLVIDSLQEKLVKIPIKFLAQYPENPKLISGYFSKDSLNLSFLHPNGLGSKNVYEVNYNQYRYYWSDNNLRAEKINGKKESKNIRNELWSHLGINSYTSSIFLDVDYRFSYKKIEINTRGTYLINPNLPFVSLGLGYKIK